MNNTKKLVQVGILWGVLGGILCSGYIIALAFISVNPLGPLKYIYFSLYGLVFGLMMYKSIKIAGKLHFFTAFFSCTVLNISASVVFFEALYFFLSNPISQPSMQIYIKDLKKYMQDTKLSFIAREGGNEFDRKYIIKDGKIFRGRTEVDSTKEMIEKYEGQRIFDSTQRKTHEFLLSQIDKVKPLDIAIDQTIVFFWMGVLLSFYFSVFFRSP